MNTRDDNWFIDAWSVMDGYAFASRRTSDSLQADAVFFVGPPYFEPEPVASLAGPSTTCPLPGRIPNRGPGSGIRVPWGCRRSGQAGILGLAALTLEVRLRLRPSAPARAARRRGESIEALVSDELRDTWRVSRLLRDDCVSERAHAMVGN